jgi:RecA-family ATPase
VKTQLSVGDVFLQNNTNSNSITYEVLYKTNYTDSKGEIYLLFNVNNFDQKSNYFYTTTDVSFKKDIDGGFFNKIKDGYEKSESLYLNGKVYTKQQLEEILAWWEK